MSNTTEIACEQLVFHFNKGHLTDPTLPMWCVKTKGETYYVEHVDCNIAWSTKETPDNESTKGSIKIKHCKLVINDQNHAVISKLSLAEKLRLGNEKVKPTRILFDYGSDMHDALLAKEFQHSKIKAIAGACGTEFGVCDLLDKNEVIIATLKYDNDFRILKSNEPYYQAYKKLSPYIDEVYEDE